MFMTLSPAVRMLDVLNDEAHLLTHEQLEDLRMLPSADMDSRSPVSVVLIGQPTLRRRLHQGALAAVDQRVHRNGGPGRAERSLLAAQLADNTA